MRKHNASKIININTFLIKKYNVESIPSEAFRGLRINSLIMGENSLRRVKNDSFSGVESVRVLRLIEPRLAYMERDCLAPLNASLAELGLWQLDFAHEDLLDSVFGELSRLANVRTLKLMGYGVRRLRSHWLIALARLHSLSLASNALQSLQANMFLQSYNLTLISLDLS